MAQAKIQAQTPAPDVTPVYSARKRISPEEVEHMRIKDRELVRGIFRFFEVPGGNMSFSFLKYKGDKVENYTMNDGEIYTVPRGVAHHLANNCWYPESAHKMDEFGRIVASVSKKKRRCSFEPLDFMDATSLRELTPANLETVTFYDKSI